MELRELLALEEKLLTRKRINQMIRKAKMAAELVKREYGADVYLFGSLAENRVHARSDVDLMICGAFSEAQKREIVRKVECNMMPCSVDVLFEDEVSAQFGRSVKERGVRLTC